MVLSLFSFFPLVFFMACQQGSPSASATTHDQQAGKSVYQKYCVACHGSQGDLGLQGAPNLKTSALDEQARIEVITHGRGVMPAYEVLLTKEEIQAVAQYTLSLQ
jgi:cytochrome c6